MLKTCRVSSLVSKAHAKLIHLVAFEAHAAAALMEWKEPRINMTAICTDTIATKMSKNTQNCPHRQLAVIWSIVIASEVEGGGMSAPEAPMAFRKPFT